MNEELSVGYHQQDTSYYCGAACAQMVLHSIGQPLISQDDLYNDNHSHSVEPSYWSTPPDGLQWTLNNRQSGKYFALDSDDTVDSICRMLCWTIHYWKVSPIALVEDGNHLVVVHGYTASAAAPMAERLYSGERLLPASVIEQQFRTLLQRGKLLAHPAWANVMESLQPRDSVLVQRLDCTNSYYWIVPAVDSRGDLRAAVRFDARFGDYQQAIKVQNPQSNMFGFRSNEELVRHVMERRIDLTGDGGRLILHPEAISIYPCLVWRPCRQSLSPFYPFRMITIGAIQLFVRIFDGEIFVGLTADKGGI